MTALSKMQANGKPARTAKNAYGSGPTGAAHQTGQSIDGNARARPPGPNPFFIPLK